MPAMPTMNMPAMRNEVKLPHAGGGVYRGPGQVLMGGTWDVTVTATRAGQQIGSRKFPLVAR
jgi:YtkA-like